MAKKHKEETRGAPEVYSTKSMIDAVIEAQGYVVRAAAKIGCTPQIIHVRALYEKELQKAIDDSRNIRKQMLKDEECEILESAYKSAKVLNDQFNPTMTIFTLKALAGWKDGGSEKEIELNPAQRAAMAKEKADD